jgi:HTH-type transcriptional regulator/antitoxin HigA
MHLKVIKNESEHQQAIAALLELMDRNPPEGSPAADELDVLSVLIERYEEEHFPVDLPGPIEAIRFRMEQQGLTQKDMVPYFGSASRVSEVLNGKRQLSINMMRKLNRVLGIPAEVLLHEAEGELPSATAWDPSVLKAMLDRGYFDGFQGTFQELKEYAEEWVDRFTRQVPGITPTPPALLRSTAHQRSSPKKVNELALWAWQTRVQQKAATLPLRHPFVPRSVDIDFMRRLAGESWAESGPLRAREFLNHHGIHLIVEPHLPKTYLDGAAMRDAQGHPIVALTLRHDRVDNFWFTLMHELAHVALHLEQCEVFMDDLDASGNTDTIENEADHLASEALIPSDEWHKVDLVSAADVCNLARKLHIHPAIVAGRWQREAGNYRKFSKLLGRNQVRQYFDG